MAARISLRLTRPQRQAVIVRGGTVLRDVGRISLTRHWRKIFLRDIELMGSERNHGVGTAIITAVVALARRLRSLCRAAGAAVQSRATALRAARIPSHR